MTKKTNFNKRAKTFWASLGYVTEIVEHYNAFSGRKNDFCGFADAICLNPNVEKNKILSVQITSKSNLSTRFNKITKPTIKDTETKEDKPNPVPAKAKTWLQSGGGLWILGFESKDKTCKIREVFLNENNNEFLYKDYEIGGKDDSVSR
jgi:hypothetical protein